LLRVFPVVSISSSWRMAAVVCGVCMEEMSMEGLSSVPRTSCCEQPLCLQCFEEHHARSADPGCPFCRQSGYSLADAGDVAQGLEGEWAVNIKEKSRAGCRTRRASLQVVGGTGFFEALDSTSGKKDAWSHVELRGRSFSADHCMCSLPSWVDESARLCSKPKIEGRIVGKDLAKFRTTFNIADRRGNTMEVVREGEMTRTRRRCSTISL
jgi:hypothetical protein